jgi:small-conductance mechanosensitive channel
VLIVAEHLTFVRLHDLKYNPVQIFLPHWKMNMKNTFDTIFGLIIFENSLAAWLVALGFSLGFLLVLLTLKVLFVKRMMGVSLKTGAKANSMMVAIIGQTRFLFLFFVAIFLGSLLLTLPDTIRFFIQTVAIIALLIQTGFWTTALVSFYIAARRTEQLADEAGSVFTLNAIEVFAKGAIWTLVLLLSLDNIPQIQITALIASLGIGGIAIGLAVQNILGDLFASLSIALDKPFIIGDFINVGEYSGTVEYIGLKSTRLRSISGEQVVFSNSDLLGSRIRNFKRMERRRVVFTINVTYDTPAEKLKSIPGLIRDILNEHEQATFDRVHFKTFEDSSLAFEVVFFMEVPDFMSYMDVQQAVNLSIYECFEREGISFAYPTQTIYLQKGDDVQLNGLRQQP